MRVLVLAVVAALALAAGGYAGTAAATYKDAAGDSGTAADITSVSASVDSTQEITFRIELSRVVGVISVYIDSDADSHTGSPSTDGADFDIDYDATEGVFYFSKWTGSEWDGSIPYSTVGIRAGSNQLAVSVNRSELPGAVEDFDFWVATVESWDQWGEGHFDSAPDAGMYYYSFAPLRLGFEGFSAIPAKGTLVISGAAQRSDTGGYLGTEGTIKCKATVAGRALRLATSGVLLKGKDQTPVATCTFVVPKSLRGKRVRGQLSFGIEGIWAEKVFETTLK